MKVFQEVKKFVGCDDNDLNTSAAKIITYTTELEKGNITKEEYNELLRDLKILEDVDLTAAQLENRVALNQIIAGLIAASSVI